MIPWDTDLTWADNMYRAGTSGGDEPFKSRILAIPALNIEFQNRLRELRDLLLNPDQEGQIIDETAAKVYTPGQPSFESGAGVVTRVPERRPQVQRVDDAPAHADLSPFVIGSRESDFVAHIGDRRGSSDSLRHCRQCLR